MHSTDKQLKNQYSLSGVSITCADMYSQVKPKPSSVEKVLMYIENSRSPVYLSELVGLVDSPSPEEDLASMHTLGLIYLNVANGLAELSQLGKRIAWKLLDE